MKLLVVTQKVDATDANLGFFVRWLGKLAEHADITVIANEVHSDAAGYLPNNVCVLSLGKECGVSRAARFLRYQKLLWRYLPQADGVFFHMCPEYVLGAHFLPRIFRTRALLWYVHKEVSLRLRFAAMLVDKIFTASPESCRLRSKKVEIVGHGVTADFFVPRGEAPRDLRLITAGRIAPVKDLRTLILGFLELRKGLPDATFSVVGEPITNADCVYREELRGLSTAVRFLGGVSHGELPRLLGEATAFIHASRTGSMDKAALEALASGLPVFTSSEAFSEDIPGITKFEAGNPADLAEKIERAFVSGSIVVGEAGRAFVREKHSLNRLIQRILSFYEINIPTY